MENSKMLRQEENQWMLMVIQIIRKTALFFQPQIRTKIMNEGWASYWHETLFMNDDRIKGHEVDFARVNAGVTAMPRVGLNPYALGMRLFYFLEEMAEKGKVSWNFSTWLTPDNEKHTTPKPAKAKTSFSMYGKTFRISRSSIVFWTRTSFPPTSFLLPASG
jgi:spore cortex formation protein SpoVR/YcgB (stage V sporulation)